MYFFLTRTVAMLTQLSLFHVLICTLPANTTYPGLTAKEGQKGKDTMGCLTFPLPSMSSFSSDLNEMTNIGN